MEPETSTRAGLRPHERLPQLYGASYAFRQPPREPSYTEAADWLAKVVGFCEKDSTLLEALDVAAYKQRHETHPKGWGWGDFGTDWGWYRLLEAHAWLDAKGVFDPDRPPMPTLESRHGPEWVLHELRKLTAFVRRKAAGGVGDVVDRVVAQVTASPANTTGIVEALDANSRAAGQPEPQAVADGPGPGFREWTHQGSTFTGMQEKPWRLASFLWKQPGWKADIMDLAEPVWGDESRFVEPEAVRINCRRARDWFRKKGIPLAVERGGTIALMKRLPE